MTAHDEFIAAFDRAIADRTLASLVLSKNRRGLSDLQSVRVRSIELRGEPALSFVWRHTTRDVTRNLDPGAGRAAVLALLEEHGDPSFAHATLHAGDTELQLRFSKKGKQALVRAPRPAGDADDARRPGVDRHVRRGRDGAAGRWPGPR